CCVGELRIERIAELGKEFLGSVEVLDGQIHENLSGQLSSPWFALVIAGGNSCQRSRSLPPGLPREKVPIRLRLARKTHGDPPVGRTSRRWGHSCLVCDLGAMRQH